MNISLEVKNHVMIFFDGSYKYITAQQGEGIMGLTGNAESVEIDGQLYKISSIQKVLTTESFSEQYPEKIRQERENDVPVYPTLMEYERVEEWQGERALKGLLKGINQFIDKRTLLGLTADHAIELKVKWELKLKNYAQMQKVSSK